MFDYKIEGLQKILSSISVSDNTTKETIKMVYEKYNYTLDPHGAIGYYALKEFLNSSSFNTQLSTSKGLFLETAHPVKFPNTVEEMTGKKIEIPEFVKHLFDKQKQSTVIENNFNALKQWMMAR